MNKRTCIMDKFIFHVIYLQETRHIMHITQLPFVNFNNSNVSVVVEVDRRCVCVLFTTNIEQLIKY